MFAGLIKRLSRRVRMPLILCLFVCLFWFFFRQDSDVQVDSDVAKLVVFHDNLHRQSDQMCVHPQLDPFHPSIIRFFHHVPVVNCSRDRDWVYVSNGTFHISEMARRRYGNITCEYTPIVRGPNDFSNRQSDPIKSMPDGAALTSDFFKVACVSINGKKYFNIHSGIAYNKTLHSWSDQTKPEPKNALDLDVLMFGFDSLSRMSWIRTLPKTREYFLKQLHGIEMEGYNILGDGTPAALLPILTGETEEELPEARRGKPGAKTVDNHPWIWKDFKKNGYLTLWAEDGPSYATFQYRMLGFKHQPTDHYMRTFYLSAGRMHARKGLCLGSVPLHQNFMKWFKDAYRMYGKRRKFMFGFHSEISHQNNNMMQVVDKDAKEFLEFLENNGYLNRTILIMMSDHGARFSNVRATVQGKVEERMPYFAFRFPPWFEKQYPGIVRNVRTNANRLTTPFDIHATFLDILNYTGGGVGNIAQRGISVFKEIPKERTCTHAGIEAHWCACLAWKVVDSLHPVVQAAVSAAIDCINEYTESQRPSCAYLKLKSVTRSVKGATNSKVLKFKKSADVDGRVADLSDNKTKPEEDFYQVTFLTTPGNGQFEVTLKHSLKNSKIQINEKEISRINRYGSDPACIQDEHPHLRQYCYCNNLLQ